MTIQDRIRSEIADPAGKRRYVQDLFGRVAPRYDLTNDVMSIGMHRRWKRRLVELAECGPDLRVLDLAAGTGDLAIRAAGARSTVFAADLTTRMMRAGMGRPEGPSVTWLACDGLALPFQDGSFDRIVIGYGLRNFADLEAGLAEILRCLRPGGRLLSLDFGKPDSPVLRRLYYRYLEMSTAAVGWLLHRSPESYLYIPESLRAYPAQRGLLRVMQRMGYVRCGFFSLHFGAMAINFGERPAA